MDVFSRTVKDIQIHPLAEFLAAEGAVAVGNNVALRLGDHSSRLIDVHAEIRLVFRDVPHLQEQHGEAAHSLAAHHDRGVLPVTEALDLVYVFVREINSASKGDLSVYDHYLPVIAVVVVGGEKRRERREYLAVYAEFLQLLWVVPG